MDAIAFLRQEHLTVLELLDKIEKGPTDDQLAERKGLVDELITALSRHETVEVLHFWPKVRAVLVDGEQLTARAIDQENTAKDILDQLGRGSPGEPEFEQLLTALLDDVRAHIAYEQDEVWPKLTDALDAGALEQLGTSMAEAKKTAPTRHPRILD